MNTTEGRFGPAKRVKTPLVSVIIPVYRDEVRLEKCLKALEAQTYPGDRYEVIVVDNGLNENIETIPGKYRHARLLKEERRGAYAARNKGVSAASGEVLAFTDSDCVPIEKWLEKGIEKLLRTPGCGQVAGNIVFSFKNGNEPSVIELYDSYIYLNNERYMEKEHFAASANTFILKEVIDRVGPFDGSLISGGDYELGQRIYAAGYKQGYCAEAGVFHPARTSLSGVIEKRKRVAAGEYAIPATRQPLIKRVKPFIGGISEYLKDNRIGNLGRRLQFIMIHAATGVAGVCETAKLRLRGRVTNGHE